MKKNENQVTKNLETKKCFIITPIGHDGSEINREAIGIVDVVLKPLLFELNCEVTSALDFNTGQITDQIIKSIYESDLIIANLTEQNPNVMYELALAHAFEKKTIHIIQKGGLAPFDVGVHKYYEYVNDVRGAQELEVVLRGVVQTALFNEEIVSNPVVGALTSYNVAQPKHLELNMLDAIEALIDKKLNGLTLGNIGKSNEVTSDNNKYDASINYKIDNNIANNLQKEYLNKLSPFSKLSQNERDELARWLHKARQSKSLVTDDIEDMSLKLDIDFDCFYKFVTESCRIYPLPF